MKSNINPIKFNMRSETSTIFKTLISSNYVMVGALEVYTCHHNAEHVLQILVGNVRHSVSRLQWRSFS